MNPLARLNKFLSRLPVHTAIILMCVFWIIPTVGLFVTSFRPREAIRISGWWTVFTPKPQVGKTEYTTYCASCHGETGDAIPGADLSNPQLVDQFP